MFAPTKKFIGEKEGGRGGTQELCKQRQTAKGSTRRLEYPRLRWCGGLALKYISPLNEWVVINKGFGG